MLEQTVSPSHVFEPIDQVAGAFLLKRKVHNDDRGSFAELLRDDWDVEIEPGKRPIFVQSNHSFNHLFSLRGMHMQRSTPQGKLITCTYGRILDVIFDVRKDSKTFMQGFSTLLDFETLASLYAPPGVFHGFIAVSQFSVVNYQCTSLYDVESQAGVRWDSPEIRELWMEYCTTPTLSVKDATLPTLAEFLEEPK